MAEETRELSNIIKTFVYRLPKVLPTELCRVAFINEGGEIQISFHAIINEDSILNDIKVFINKEGKMIPYEGN